MGVIVRTSDCALGAGAAPTMSSMNANDKMTNVRRFICEPPIHLTTRRCDSCTVPALSCGRKHGQENMGRESINQSRQRRISGRTSMQAFTARHDLMKTQGVLTIYVCLCVFLTGSAFAQNQKTKSGAYRQKVRAFYTAEEFARLTEGKVHLYKRPTLKVDDGASLVGANGIILYREKNGQTGLSSIGALPVHEEVTVIAKGSSGEYWIGTKKGAIFVCTLCIATSYEYFAGGRWLPDDHVIGIGFEPGPNRAAWLETPGGYSRIEYKTMTLAEKSKAFVERVRARHVRHGLTADSILQTPGDLSTNRTVSSDNDGLWTQMYVAAEAFRYKVTGEAEKRKIRGVVARMTDHILNNNYQLIDVDGKRTRWGWWGPEEIWADPDETGLRALHILSHLRVAHHITGNPRYEQAYNELISKRRYHLLTRNQKVNYPGHVNHSDDELAFLSYYPLLNYETDPKLRGVYVQSLERSWQVERPERNPLWNFIYAVGSGSKEFGRDEAVRTLREIPMDQISWTVTNLHRLDVPMDVLNDRFDRKQTLIVLPYDELPMNKWNGNPYRIDGGNGGRSEGGGVYFLLPYWMGRYHKLIDG